MIKFLPPQNTQNDATNNVTTLRTIAINIPMRLVGLSWLLLMLASLGSVGDRL